MGFGLGLHTCNLGDAVQEWVNPFTGETIRAAVDVGLSDTERASLFRLLAELRADGPDDSGYRRLRTSGNGDIGIYFGWPKDTDPIRGIMLEIEGDLDDAIADVIWRLATTANACISSTVGDRVIALTRRYTDERVHERWPNAAYVSSAAELRDWLTANLRSGAIV